MGILFLIPLLIFWIVFLLILGFVAASVVGVVCGIYRKNKWAGKIAGWTAGALAAALCLGIFFHFQPYSKASARLFYQTHKELLNSVSEVMIELSDEDWREEAHRQIPEELNRVEAMFCRCRHPSVYKTRFKGSEAVAFYIYWGKGVDSGDGSLAYPYQELVYAPGIDPVCGESYEFPGRYACEVADGWYLNADYDL